MTTTTTASTIQTDVPLVNVPFVNTQTGAVTEAWFIFLIQLWRRTGGSSGVPPDSLTIDDVLSVEQTVAQPSIDVLLQALAVGHTYAVPDVQAPLLSDLMASPSTQDSLGDVVYAPSVIQNDFWTAPTLLNSWVYYGSPYNPPGYYKDSFGIVHLRGLVKSGTMTNAIFTLPAGYRPANRQMNAAASFVSTTDAYGRIDVDNAGNVLPMAGSNAFISMDNITFRAEL